MQHFSNHRFFLLILAFKSVSQRPDDNSKFLGRCEKNPAICCNV